MGCSFKHYQQEKVIMANEQNRPGQQTQKQDKNRTGQQQQQGSKMNQQNRQSPNQNQDR